MVASAGDPLDTKLQPQERKIIMSSSKYISFQGLSEIEVFVLHNGATLTYIQGIDPLIPGFPELPGLTVDSNVLDFQAISSGEVYALGTDGNLWHETGPWGTAPPARQHVDGNVHAFQALDSTHAYVLGNDGNLWFETGPWGTVPPARQQVDGSVAFFQALDADTVYVLGRDGKLWLETGPWGTVPPARQQVDGNVASFQALDDSHVYVLGGANNLWFETGPWGTVPPARQQVDGNVSSFQALDGGHAYVVGRGGNLWFESGPWGTVPPARHQVDANVFRFQALDGDHAYVLGSDSNLWLENGPWGTVPPARSQVTQNVSPVEVPPPPPAFQLAIDWPSISLDDDGISTNGSANVVMNQDGSCTFSGYLYDSGFWSADVAIVFVVRDSDGWGYVFSASGHVQGPDEAGFNVPNRDWSFNLNSTSQDVASRWAKLQAGYSWDAHAEASSSPGDLLNSILNDFKAAEQAVEQWSAVIGTL